MNDRVAALLALCVVGILGCSAMGAFIQAPGGWESARWGGEKMWELVLILTGGKLALVYQNGHGTPVPSEATTAERRTVTPSGPSGGS